MGSFGACWLLVVAALLRLTFLCSVRPRRSQLHAMLTSLAFSRYAHWSAESGPFGSLSRFLLLCQGVPDSFVAGRYHSLYGIRTGGKWPSCLVRPLSPHMVCTNCHFAWTLNLCPHCCRRKLLRRPRTASAWLCSTNPTQWYGPDCDCPKLQIVRMLTLALRATGRCPVPSRIHHDRFLRRHADVVSPPLLSHIPVLPLLSNHWLSAGTT